MDGIVAFARSRSPQLGGKERNGRIAYRCGSPDTCFAGLHECSYRTAFRSRALNDGAAGPLGLLSLHNATAYRRHHPWHQRGDLPAGDQRLALVERQAGHLGRLLWGDLSALPYLNAEVIPRVRRSAWLQAGVCLALGQPFPRFVLLAELSGCSFSSDRTTNTRTTLTTWPVRWLMGNMPFHAKHHLVASIPFHSPPAAQRQITPTSSTSMPVTRPCTAGCWPTWARRSTPSPPMPPRASSWGRSSASLTSACLDC